MTFDISTLDYRIVLLMTQSSICGYVFHHSSDTTFSHFSLESKERLTLGAGALVPGFRHTHAYIVEPKLYSYSLFIHLECNTKERTTALRFCLCQTGHSAWFGLCPVPGLWGSLPYIGYIGMCGAKGYGFLAILVSEIGYQF